MISLSTLRSSFGRAPWWRGFAALLILSLLAGSIPRWQVHAHESADHPHEHAVAIDDHDSRAPVDGTDAELAAMHLHDVAPASCSLGSTSDLELAAIPPCNWRAPINAPPATLAAGPPPQRPPIT